MKSKRTLTALATVVAAVGVAIGSGATFTAQSANPANTLTSGTLTMSNTKAGVAIVSGVNAKPGDVNTGQVTIKNTEDRAVQVAADHGVLRGGLEHVADELHGVVG